MKVRFGGYVLRLVLVGIAASALLSVGVGILKYLADPIRQLPEIVFWLLSGLWAVKWNDLIYLLPIISLVIFIIFLLRWRLNVLTLSREMAHSSEINRNRETMLSVFIAVVITAAVVSVASIVGWIGLVIHNIARIISEADTAKSVPYILP